MTEEEKKNFKHIKERAEYVSENILGTNVFTTYDVYCVNMLIEIIQKQDTEINKLNNVIQNIREEFLKYDWENSTKEQICNQLKGLYESIFMEEDK